MEININNLYRNKRTKKVYKLISIVNRTLTLECLTTKGKYVTGYKDIKNRFIPFEDFKIIEGNLYKNIITLEIVPMKNSCMCSSKKCLYNTELKYQYEPVKED